MLTNFQAGNTKRRDHLEEVVVDGRILVKWISGDCYENVWTGFIWLRIGSSGGLF
jgi:hypothetical protein